MELPYGLSIVSNYALVAARHAHQYGTTPQQLAEIAVVTRRHAMRNPLAVEGLRQIGMKNIGEITVDSVVSSPLISDPLHLLDCCLVTDGGGALVLASAAAAAGARHRSAWVTGYGTGVRYPSNNGDITVTAASQSGPAARRRAGVSPADADVAMLYDSFTITVLTALEDIGFCAKGEGGSYVEGGRLATDRSDGPALNTAGGGLSSCHPGMRGLFLIAEAVRQLRGAPTSRCQMHRSPWSTAMGCSSAPATWRLPSFWKGVEMTGDFSRPLPDLDEPDTARFWAATREHRLIYGVCDGCGEVPFYLRRLCPKCGSPVGERTSEGRGLVYACTIVRRTPVPAFRERVPFALCFIDLTEGFRILSEAELDADGGPRIGDRVELLWEDHEEVSIPLFRRAGGPG